MFHLGTINSVIASIHPATIPIIIIIVSIIAFTIIIERTVYFWKLKPISPEDFRKVKDLLIEKQWDNAKDYLATCSHGPTTAILQTGIEYKRRESKYYEGPLLGVLGTVVGMIRSFAEGAGTKGAEVGISEALITTALGLSVSIPAYIFYNYLVRKKEEKIAEMENVSDQFIQVFHREKV